MTLYTSTLAEVSGLATDDIGFHTCRARTEARLVLVDATELSWQRRRYREDKHLFVPADPVLVGFNTLQSWLWQRLRTTFTEKEYVNASHA